MKLAMTSGGSILRYNDVTFGKTKQQFFPMQV